MTEVSLQQSYKTFLLPYLQSLLLSVLGKTKAIQLYSTMASRRQSADLNLTTSFNDATFNTRDNFGNVMTHEYARMQFSLDVNFLDLNRQDHNRAIENSEPSEHSRNNDSEDGSDTSLSLRVSINGEPLRERLERVQALGQYLVLLLIILAKFTFDRFTSLLVLILVWYAFSVGNRIVKRILALSENFSPRCALELLSMFAIIPSLIFLFYRNHSSNLYYIAVLLPSDYEFRTPGDLLWIIIVSDYVIKLVTVVIKGFYATSSCVCFRYKQRGKHLALMEFTSQLYRSLAPVQPWLTFLMGKSTGIQKVIGIFLSVIYLLCKIHDFDNRVKTFLNVIRSAPSKSQLNDAGNTCPICKGDFAMPFTLQCKHVFCEECVTRWFGYNRTCPICRTEIADDLSYRDGTTSHSIQCY